MSLFHFQMGRLRRGGGEGALGKCPRVIHGGGGRGSQGFQPGGLTPVEVTGMLTSGLKLASPQVH